MKDPVMKRAFDAWEELSRDEKKRVEYESRLKAILDEMAAVKEAEIRQQRAREEGLAEGRAEGERQIAMAVARNMLVRGMEVAIVTELTGLSAEEIEKLKQQLQ